MNKHRVKHDGQYTASVNLPKTTFPMRADLPQREPEILGFWERIDLYRCAQERTAGREKFILHDGPPFSNGEIHLGHALNKILKDMIVKFRSMQGYDAPFVPGWDTHGLPTEIVALRLSRLDRKALDPISLRRRCAETARKFIDLQRAQFRRLGVRGDWDRPYLTMQPAYEATVLEAFGALVEAGLIYRGLKPVFWCTHCETALAEAEVEYLEHESHSIYVAFPALRLPEQLFPDADRASLSAVIWTTTPWTLPANVAIAVHPEIRYVLVTDGAGQEPFTYLVAKEAVERFADAVGLASPRVLGEVSGRELAGAVFLHPFMEREAPIVEADFVTVESGTGLVHMAPGHGEEDFIAGITYGLPVIQPVSPEGIFGPEAGPFAGKPIYEAQEDILERMDKDGTLLAHDTILHQYPHCWRCHAPVIFRATPQWFFAVNKLAQEALAAIDNVEWIPAWGRQRISGMVTDRPDWCISRQRRWGTPIPAVYCEQCDAPLVTAEIARSAAAIAREDGADAWFRRPVMDFLPAETRCPNCGGTQFRKETDIFDVWFDSACSHLAVLAARDELAWPADLYLEGQDQHRGWFQVSLLMALGTGREAAPYRAVLTHGFILDQTGQKQSKSLGNIIDPQDVVKKYGADVLRLWVAAVDYRADIAMSEDVLTRVIESYRRIRNTVRFLLGNLYDFSPALALPVEELAEIDRWALTRLQALLQRVTEAFARYEFHRVYHALNEFCTSELSAFYLDVVKDRLYVLPPADPARRSTQTVLHLLAVNLACVLAPILSFTAEEIWQHLPERDILPPSVQLADWPAGRPEWQDVGLAAKWVHLLAVREVVSAALDAVRITIPQPSAAKVTIFSAGEPGQVLESFGNTLSELLRVSATAVERWEAAPAEAYRGALPEVAVLVEPAPGRQCPRCRLWRVPREGHPHAELCVRCAGIVEEMAAARSHRTDKA